MSSDPVKKEEEEERRRRRYFFGFSLPEFSSLGSLFGSYCVSLKTKGRIARDEYPDNYRLCRAVGDTHNATGYCWALASNDKITHVESCCSCYCQCCCCCCSYIIFAAEQAEGAMNNKGRLVVARFHFFQNLYLLPPLSHNCGGKGRREFFIFAVRVHVAFQPLPTLIKKNPLSWQ